MHVYKDLLRCKSVGDAKPGMPLASPVVQQMMVRFRNCYSLQKVKILFKKAQCLPNRCKDLFKGKKWGARCTLKKIPFPLRKIMIAELKASQLSKSLF